MGKYIYKILTLILVLYSCYSLWGDLSSIPDIRLTRNGDKLVADLSKREQKEIYQKLQLIEYEEDFDLETYKLPWDYGFAHVMVSYHESGTLHEWYIDAAHIHYNVYDKTKKKTYGRIDNELELYCYLMNYFEE